MKRILFIPLAVALGVACSSSNNNDSGTGGEPEPSTPAPAVDAGKAAPKPNPESKTNKDGGVAPAPKRDGGTSTPTTDGGSNPPRTDGGSNPPRTDGGSNPPRTDGGSNPPPPPVDAGSVDASRPDANPPPPPVDAGSCTPTLNNFTPFPYPMPTGKFQNKCTATDLTNLDACFAGDNAACSAISQDCNTCAASMVSDPNWGPIVITDPNTGEGFYNVFGCLGLIAGDTNANGCGAAMLALSECASVACETCADDASSTACRQAAATSVCSTYKAAYDTKCAAALANPASDACFTGTDSQFVNVFCGR